MYSERDAPGIVAVFCSFLLKLHLRRRCDCLTRKKYATAIVLYKRKPRDADRPIRIASAYIRLSCRLHHCYIAQLDCRLALFFRLTDPFKKILSGDN